MNGHRLDIEPGVICSMPARSAVHPSCAQERLVKRWRRPPLQHPLAPIFERAVESLSTALGPGSKRSYITTVRRACFINRYGLKLVTSA
jgi:hypothetical protein